MLPLNGQTVALLSSVESRQGTVFDGSNLRAEWEMACASVGLGSRAKVIGPANTWYRYRGLRLHDPRRSAVRNMRVLGKAMENEAMKISGHKTRAVFHRHNIVITDDLHAVSQAVEVAMLALASGKNSSVQNSVQSSQPTSSNPH